MTELTEFTGEPAVTYVSYVDRMGNLEAVPGEVECSRFPNGSVMTKSKGFLRFSPWMILMMMALIIAMLQYLHAFTSLYK